MRAKGKATTQVLGYSESARLPPRAYLNETDIERVDLVERVIVIFFSALSARDSAFSTSIQAFLYLFMVIFTTSSCKAKYKAELSHDALLTPRLQFHDSRHVTSDGHGAAPSHHLHVLLRAVRTRLGFLNHCLCFSVFIHRNIYNVFLQSAN